MTSGALPRPLVAAIAGAVVAACALTSAPSSGAATGIVYIGSKGEVRIVDPASDVSVPVTRPPSPFGTYAWPQWSPDHAHIAAVGRKPGSHHTAIVVMK